MERSLFLSLSLLSAAFAFTFSCLQHAGNAAETDDFVRRCCNNTSHADICYESLHPFAPVVGQDLYKLSRIAMSLSLFKTRRLMPRQNHSDTCGGDKRAVEAASDCRSDFEDSMDEIRDSRGQLRLLGGGRKVARERAMLLLSDVLTWMSAALTDLDTCKERFEGVEDCPLMSRMFLVVDRATMYTSNALALVSQYRDTLR